MSIVYKATFTRRKVPERIMAGENTITGILNKYGALLSAELKNDIQQKALTKYGVVNASGNLAKSIRQEIKDNILRIYAAEYIYYVEKGRKPGKKPPRKVIRDWLNVKPAFASLSDKKKDSIAFLIQRKIAEKGTTIFQQGGSRLTQDILSNELKGEIQSELILNFRKLVTSQTKNALLGK